MSRALLVCLCLGLGFVAACRAAMPAQEQPVAAQAYEPEAKPAPREPGDVYVVLPTNYSRYVDDKLLFASGGKREDLPVYASAGDALRALHAFESVSERARRVWSVYRLNADWARDVVTLEGGEHRLKAPVKVLNVEK
jgi:hypothetical protein